MSDNSVTEKMNAALEKAIQDYEENPPKTAEDLIGWIYKWFRLAGYKRLCRYLISLD